MCDLIDLNSPDTREALKPAKLASPLIPAPKNDVGCKTDAESATRRREGDSNNPFDRVLHETVEYVSKKGDPFEMMLQRALKSKDWRNVQPKDFTDDFTPRRKKRYVKAMNKTLDVFNESLLKSKFSLFDGDKRETKLKTDSVDINARSPDICDAIDNASVIKQEHKISVAGSDSLELSILNQSAMNDVLLEAFPKFQEDGKESPFVEQDMPFEGYIFPSNIKHLMLPNIQRSLSQGAGNSPTELLCPLRRSQSVTDSQRKASQSTIDNSTISSFLDRGFLESKLSEQSVLSSLSNVSSIIKLNSASLSSLVSSNDVMNHAFFNNGSLKTSQEKMNAIDNSMEMKPKQYLSDLVERFNKLKYTINDTTNISSVTKDDCNRTEEENNKQITDNKLIDVDVFMPELNKEFNRSSSSTCSSDSVFTNTVKVNKSILTEAKMLAKTFEELALKTDSGSSMDDDLISNNTLWISELLPAFEDEVVDDLIDLPESPEGNLKNIKNSDVRRKMQSPASIDSMEENSLKKVESPFTDIVKQDVTSLLADLRKLIKTESDPLRAKELLDDLESILNINYKNNTELLATFLNTSNKSRSPQKISLDSIEKVDKSNTDKSEEESDKVLSQEKMKKNEKSPDINCILKNISQDISSDKSSVTSSSCKGNNEDSTNTSNSSDLTEHNNGKEKDNQVDKKIAVELLVNLQKLLSGQTEDDTTIQLLQNIGKALNTALNNNIENEMPANCTRKQNIQQTTLVRTSESNRNAHSSALATKVGHRRSLESKSKKTVRRSLSAIESSPKSSSSTQLYRRRTSEVENHQKRFSSDSEFINIISNKKLSTSETYNIKKVETTGLDSKKEKSIALSDVKNKLKKRSDVVSKKGPMKAVHPVDNMQRKRAISIGRQAPFSQITTPPKSNKSTPLGNKIISSTPNSDSNYEPKKSVKSKPIASSTPDNQNSKNAPLNAPVANKKRNLSCDISPVTTHINMSSSDERKDSPKRTSKLPTPKKCTTPTRQQMDAFGIPKFLTPPRHYSAFNTKNSPKKQSSQRLNRSLINFQRCSPKNEKKNVEKIRQSPLKETNRITPKVKPLNLISKIKRHSAGDFAEKENSYA